MEDKFTFTVKCEDLYELKVYTEAMKNSSDLNSIYDVARDFGKYHEPTAENYFKMSDEIKELSFREG